MKDSKLCPKCSSDSVVYPLKVKGYPTKPLTVMVPKKRSFLSLNLPVAFLPVAFSLQAAVCGNCGYTELYVADPQQLYNTWNKE